MALWLGATGCGPEDEALVTPEQPAPAPPAAPVPVPVSPPVVVEPPPPAPPPPPVVFATQVPEDVGPAKLASAEGWQFLTSAQGVPGRVYGVSADEGGNIWVAGGSVISVLRKGASRFESFSAPQLAISISGGPAGVAFVGYMGGNGCDMAWDTTGDVPLAKSGDADRVWLTGGGLARAHYDISSGKGVVPAEPQGREKLCNIFRILYDAPTQSVWFAGNHGVAWGDPLSTFVVEHTHPAINCWQPNASDASSCTGSDRKWVGGQCYKMTLCSGDFNALAMDDKGDLWLGGRERSARFPWGTTRRFYDADSYIQKESNRVDVWPDAVPRDPFPQQQVMDDTFGLAPMPDGFVFAGSSTKGLGLIDPTGKAVAWFKKPLRNVSVLALRADPLDHSVWAGHGTGGGLTRLQGRAWTHYESKALGKYASSPVVDIQLLQAPGAKRRLLVGLRNGVIGIYSGD
jgi:hypothetical protein